MTDDERWARMTRLDRYLLIIITLMQLLGAVYIVGIMVHGVWVALTT